jgi:clathrin heavy chain
MTERLADWDHDQFKKIIVKVANMEIAYKAIAFYLDRQVSHSQSTTCARY